MFTSWLQSTSGLIDCKSQLVDCIQKIYFLTFLRELTRALCNFMPTYQTLFETFQSQLNIFSISFFSYFDLLNLNFLILILSNDIYFFPFYFFKNLVYQTCISWFQYFQDTSKISSIIELASCRLLHAKKNLHHNFGCSLLPLHNVELREYELCLF